MKHLDQSRRALLVAAGCGLALLPLAGWAQEEKRASRSEALAMVKKAIEFYKKNGRDKAIAEYAKNPGPFVDRDLYVTVYTMQGDALAHINPKIVGKNMLDLRDGNGKYHIRERMEAAAKGTSGWQDFTFFNPVTKKIEPKEMYWEKYDALVFACGAYKAA
jgi:cytochrome c